VLVRLDRRPEREGVAGSGPGDRDYDRLFTVVRGGFAHRRKMLRRSLQDLVRPEAFAATGIPATARAEELTLSDWERLAGWGPEDRPGRSHPAGPVDPARPAQPGPRMGR
jgi:16S rRNA A1518/A1519 N6-dimethyltransferase RsmA/KsgA/DIM1 with predicted DNA glycosylase/AP lyase activity